METRKAVAQQETHGFVFQAAQDEIHHEGQGDAHATTTARAGPACSN